MPETRVVNVRHREPYDVYIGRAVRSWSLERSKWANPFRVVEDQGLTREMAISKYRAILLNSPHLMAALPELRGKVLACWCKPLKCHGDVLVELVAQLEMRDLAEADRIAAAGIVANRDFELRR